MDRTLKTATVSLIFNVIYGAYHIIFGTITGSRWLLTIGIYYCILSSVRFAVVCVKRNERILVKFTGWMLMLLSFPLAGTVILSLVRNRGQKFHMIIMIAIAAYSFTKISVATVKLIQSRHSNSKKTVILRNISFADASVSIFSLQRSMLVSFEGMTESEIFLMNALTGTGVCIIVFLTGFNLIKRRML